MKKFCSLAFATALASLLFISCGAKITPSTALSTASLSAETAQTNAGVLQTTDPVSSTVAESVAVTLTQTAEISEVPSDAVATMDLTPISPKLLIVPEKFETDYLVRDGAKFSDPYTFNYYYEIKVKGADEAANAAVQALYNEKIAEIRAEWMAGFTAKNEALLKQEGSQLQLLHQDLSVVYAKDMVTLYSIYRTGPYGSEWSEPEYFAINIDQNDGHIIGFDELLERLEMDRSWMASMANLDFESKKLDTIMNYSRENPIEEADIKEGRLLFTGTSLKLLADVYVGEHQAEQVILLDLGTLK